MKSNSNYRMSKSLKIMLTNMTGESKMNYKWKYCKGCHTSYIQCPKCKNNCCNGGHGLMTKDGVGIPFGYYFDDKNIFCST